MALVLLGAYARRQCSPTGSGGGRFGAADISHLLRLVVEGIGERP